MKNRTAFLLGLFCSAVAFLTLGFNYFALYQLLPIVVFYLFQVKLFKGVSSTSLKICYLLAIIILLAFPLLVQLSWYFDLFSFKSKSSTSGLIFVWLPLYALLPGLLPCVIASWIKSKNKSKLG